MLEVFGYVHVPGEAAALPVRPLRAAELAAWQRWHPEMTVAEVIGFLKKSGSYPVIEGGRNEGGR